MKHSLSAVWNAYVIHTINGQSTCDHNARVTFARSRTMFGGRDATLTPVLTSDSIILSLRANVSPCFILMRFLSRHFMAYILPVSAFRQPYTSPKPPLPIIRCTLKSFIVNCNSIRDNLGFSSVDLSRERADQRDTCSYLNI